MLFGFFFLTAGKDEVNFPFVALNERGITVCFAIHSFPYLMLQVGVSGFSLQHNRAVVRVENTWNSHMDTALDGVVRESTNWKEIKPMEIKFS